MHAVNAFHDLTKMIVLFKFNKLCISVNFANTLEMEFRQPIVFE